MDRARLLVKAQEVRSQMRSIGSLLQASVVQRRTKCGKQGCRCNEGELHTAWSVTYKDKGTTRTLTLDEAMREEVLGWARDWKRFRKLLRQHNALLLAAIRKRV